MVRQPVEAVSRGNTPNSTRFGERPLSKDARLSTEEMASQTSVALRLFSPASQTVAKRPTKLTASSCDPVRWRSSKTSRARLV